MGREVDLSNPDSWSDDDVRYLNDRGRLPADYPKPHVFDPAPPNLADVPNTGDVGTVPDDTVQRLTAENYAGASLKALRTEAEARGLDSSGSKADLVTRLEEHDDDAVLEPDGGDGGDGSSPQE